MTTIGVYVHARLGVTFVPKAMFDACSVWTVSSAKPGNGIAELRDGSNDTYWQSDGQLPHYINIEFQRKVLAIQGMPGQLQMYWHTCRDVSVTGSTAELRG